MSWPTSPGVNSGLWGRAALLVLLLLLLLLLLLVVMVAVVVAVVAATRPATVLAKTPSPSSPPSPPSPLLPLRLKVKAMPAASVERCRSGDDRRGRNGSVSAKPAVAVSVEVGGSGGGLCATSLAVSTANGLPMALGLAVASCSEVCWCCDI